MRPFASADKWSVGERLRVERVRLGFTVAALAAIGGIRGDVQSGWERGDDWPHLIELNAYACVDLDVAFVITGVRSHDAPASEANAVDALRERTGATSDSALARILEVAPSSVSRWRQRNSVPESVSALRSRGPAYTPAEIRRGIAMLPPAARRHLVLQLMSGELGG